MKITGILSVLHITDLNEIERELLSELGFKYTNNDIYGQERWEYIQSKDLDIEYHQITDGLIISSSGAVYIRAAEGYFIDKDNNKYQVSNTNSRISISLADSRR